METLNHNNSTKLQTMEIVDKVIDPDVHRMAFQFMDDSLSPSEGRDVTSQMMDQFINFYKLQHLTQWEGNHSITTAIRDKKIQKLQNLKNELKAIANEARSNGYTMSIKGTLEIKFEQ